MNNIKVAINGFGRIGRATTKILLDQNMVDIVLINDICKSTENLVYNYNYDSTYGIAKYYAKILSKKTVNFEKKPTSTIFLSQEKIENINWDKYNIDIIIDASGDNEIPAYRQIVRNTSVKKIIVTRDLPRERDVHNIIFGLNEDSYNKNDHDIISANICDSNAIAPILDLVDKKLGIKNASITTLHPWLSYQSLVDKPITKNTPWDNFALGRSSINSLIPKHTSVCSAINKVLPHLNDKIICFSYRVPTSIVSSADLTITVNEKVDKKSLHKYIKDSTLNNNIISTTEVCHPSIDFKGSSFSSIVDLNWLQVHNDKIIKLILWYDNEWAYSNRIADIVKYISK